VTATFRLVYVFVIIEVGTGRIVQWTITHHPTADWTLQQFRRCVVGDEGIDPSTLASVALLILCVTAVASYYLREVPAG
jgi:hypothetical protein